MTAPTFALGQPVQVDLTRALHRRQDTSGPADQFGHSVIRKRWASTADLLHRAAIPNVRDGVVVGARTLANGRLHFHGYDEPIEFRPEEHFTAYLVAYDLRRRPLPFRPEHLIPKETS